MKNLASGWQKKRFFADWSNIFTYGVLQSILAFSLYYTSCLTLSQAFAWDYSLLIITGTLGVYTGHLLIKSFLFERRWSLSRLIFILILSLVSIYVIFHFKSGIAYLFHLILPFIIVVIYLFPISKYIDSRFIPGWVKPVSLAFSWTWICMGPYNSIEGDMLLYAGSMFFLLLANALMFDLKDVETDKKSNKSTFAIKNGWVVTKRVSAIALLLSMISMSLFYQESLLYALLAPAILCFYFIPLLKTKTNSSNSHYYWNLDGGLFLFPVAVGMIQIVSDVL